MRFSLLTLYLFLFSFIYKDIVLSQTLQHQGTIKLSNCSHISADHHGNIYTINKNGQLYKFNQKGKLLYQSNQIKLGIGSQLDTKDPLKPLIYFQDYNIIVIMDNTLNTQQTLDLTMADVYNSRCVLRSDDDHIWIYDSDNFQLKKINMQLEVTESSMDLSQILNDNPNISQLFESGESVYALDKKNGIYVFDLYGHFEKKIPLKEAIYIYIENDILYYYVINKGLYAYNIKTLNNIHFKTSINNDIYQAVIKGNLLAILGKNQLDLYQIIL
jgi:outer membrane protein assembly factor BamB